jgi:ribonuclease HII
MVTIGIDEVGRGCWAGPLVAGAVALVNDNGPTDSSIKLRDSKKLSKKQRQTTALWIQENALEIGLGWVTPTEVDELGLTEAVRLAMSRALSAITVSYDAVIIDGNINYFPDNPKAQAIIKADDTVPSVSAASIMAKVARDAYMSNLGPKYAGYGFDTHVGYGTAEHVAAITTLGVSDIHRRSYKPIQQFLNGM